MNLGLISLICLLAAIVIGFVKTVTSVFSVQVSLPFWRWYSASRHPISSRDLVHPCASRWSVLLICLQLLTETEPWNF